MRANSENSAPDWMMAAGFSIIGFFIFLDARDDFSYDFGNYISYFDRLSVYTFDDIESSLSTFSPYPYVFVPPTGFFEAGFAIIAWAMLSIGIPSQGTYALIASSSLLLRILGMRRLGLNWPTIVATSVYSITLFEANAIRLGCALTASVFSAHYFQERRPMVGLLLVFVAASFHLQTLAYSLPFVVCWFASGKFGRTALARATILLSSILLSAVAAIAIGTLDLGKVSDYASDISGATGINTTSILGFIAISIGCIAFIKLKVLSSAALIWSSAMLASIPSIFILIYATDMGAIGDRMWQFSFTMLISTCGLIKMKLRYSKPYVATLLICLVFSTFTVTIRYPLSNFFAPIVPYAPITPFSIIL